MNPNAQWVSAVDRFGLGARHGDGSMPGDDPRGWLVSQLDAGRVRLDAAVPSSVQYLRDAAELKARRKTASGDEAVAVARKALVQAQRREFLVRQQHAIRTPHAFAERIVRFWSNHFAISVDKRVASPFAAPMEREAIRPHAFDSFAGLLIAVEQHPGMLLYLDNTRSVGDASRAADRARHPRRPGQTARRAGLNENLAREILELHTLGVNGGYAQADVQELARAISGWSLVRDSDTVASHHGFMFRTAAHEPGARTVLGKHYPEGGEDQGRAILADLALHPSTAHHLAFKLARHVVADQPPPALVERMAKAYLASDGQLVPLYRAMIEDDAAWSVDARKFKTPDDFLVSAMRAAGIADARTIVTTMNWQARLGQPLFLPGSPAGFADTRADWTGTDALLKRVQTAQLLSEHAHPAIRNPLVLAEAVHGSTLGAEIAQALQRAESVAAGLALWFASPRFQWRI